jgi:hypothetical protein
MTAHESNTSGPIFIGSLDLAKPAPQHDRLAVRRAAEWLSLGAAPTFAFMAALTAVLGGGVHEMSCATGSPTSALSGMVPMYVPFRPVAEAHLPSAKRCPRGRSYPTGRHVAVVPRSNS